MRGRVAALLPLVGRLGQHRAVRPEDDGADRGVAPLQRGRGELQRPAHRRVDVERESSGSRLCTTGAELDLREHDGHGAMIAAPSSGKPTSSDSSASAAGRVDHLDRREAERSGRLEVDAEVVEVGAVVRPRPPARRPRRAASEPAGRSPAPACARPRPSDSTIASNRPSSSPSAAGRAPSARRCSTAAPAGSPAVPQPRDGRHHRRAQLARAAPRAPARPPPGARPRAPRPRRPPRTRRRRARCARSGPTRWCAGRSSSADGSAPRAARPRPRRR